LVGSTMPKPAGIVKGRPSFSGGRIYTAFPVRSLGGTIGTGAPHPRQAEDHDPEGIRPSREVR